MFLATNRQRSCLKVLQKETTSLCSDLKLQANFVWLSHLVNFSQVQVAAALGQFGTGAAFTQVSIVDLKQPQQQKKQNENQNDNNTFILRRWFLIEFEELIFIQAWWGMNCVTWFVTMSNVHQCLMKRWGKANIGTYICCPKLEQPKTISPQGAFTWFMRFGVNFAR